MQNGEAEFNYERYACALEMALEAVAAKNGVVKLRQIHLETSVPRDLIIEVLDGGMVEFPDRVDKIVDDKEGKTWKK